MFYISLKRIKVVVLAASWLALCVPAMAVTTGQAASKQVASQSSHSDNMRTRLAACALCHGKAGQGDMGAGGGVYPRLAGQPAAYLLKQMRRFKATHRTGIPPVTTMQRLLSSLPDAFLKRIAHYYSEVAPTYPPRKVKHSAQRAQARVWVQQGIASKKVPACTECHGADLTGSLPATPALAGQNARYLMIQFDHWAQGARRNTLHEHIASALSMSQIKAIAQYLSSLRSGHDTGAVQ